MRFTQQQVDEIETLARTDLGCVPWSEAARTLIDEALAARRGKGRGRR